MTRLTSYPHDDLDRIAYVAAIRIQRRARRARRMAPTLEDLMHDVSPSTEAEAA
jgi:hypothetical protein